MRHPYQCLVVFPRSPSPGQESEKATRNFLFAASGPQIITFRLDTGKTASVWPKDASIDSQNESDEPPGKKRKVSSTTENGSNVIVLVPSKDGRHLIAVTAEDKSIRVLRVDDQGNLTQLSERCMPKRPCAIALTDDGSTILCADKFGDVYALPLIYDEPTTPEPPLREKEAEKKAFVPSATEKTVHSGRNRKALEDQRKSALKAKPKEALKFKHELLLGHVSLLTDLIFTSIKGGQPGCTRSYIITSDRDEHIRVSRGPPQSHVIENFCLGHKEFVSKMAILTPEILVSGGGDDDLLFWDWQKGTIVERLSLRSPVSRYFPKTHRAPSTTDTELAVSGIWTSFDSAKDLHILLVTLEGLPFLITRVVDFRDGQYRPTREAEMMLPGNLLDLVVIDQTMILSLDVQEDGVTSDATPRLVAFTLGSNWDGRQMIDSAVWEPNSRWTTLLESANQFESIDVDRSKLDELLYSVENLRKRGGVAEE